MSKQLSERKIPNMLKIEKNSGDIIRVRGNELLELEFYEYAINFKKSAFMLAKHLVESDDISKLDTYFFSLAYLYRHSIELLMKSIGFKYSVEVEKRIEFVKNTRHNLLSILEVIKEFVVRDFGAEMSAIHWLEELFLDMNKIDKDSDCFRYPFGIISNSQSKEYTIKPFIDEQTHVNLVLFVNKMEISFNIISSFYFEQKKITNKYTDYNPVFLEEGGSYYEQSVLGYKYSRMQFFPYIKAYTETAEFLFEFAKERDDLKSIVFFPMCYLYRNGIELAMKEILFEECTSDFQIKLKAIKKKKHSLEGIWNSIKDDVGKVINKEVYINEVVNFVDQLHRFDIASDKFRYPTNTDLKLHYKEETLFDIGNIKKYFESFSDSLYNVSAEMSDYNQFIAEMMSEYNDSSYYGE